MPGKCNNISDALSRAFEDTVTEKEFEPVILPNNMKEYIKEYIIEGGGDSLFKAISIGLYKNIDKHEEIRKKLFNATKSKPALYGLLPKDTSLLNLTWNEKI